MKDPRNIPGTGNNLEDRWDEELDNEQVEERYLECGCLKGNCTCDSWHDRD